MCGIAGFFSTEPRPRTVGARMLHELRRRGPDAKHQVTWDAAFRRDATGPVSNALLHARLSIIDPRPEADQPMSNAAGDVWICYNGEVYDWAAHADELRAKGAVFRTRSDTEFILHAYEAWGDECLSRLRGMFAFAILDCAGGACCWRATAWVSSRSSTRCGMGSSRSGPRCARCCRSSLATAGGSPQRPSTPTWHIVTCRHRSPSSRA